MTTSSLGKAPAHFTPLSNNNNNRLGQTRGTGAPCAWRTSYWRSSPDRALYASHKIGQDRLALCQLIVQSGHANCSHAKLPPQEPLPLVSGPTYKSSTQAPEPQMPSLVQARRPHSNQDAPMHPAWHPLQAALRQQHSRPAQPPSVSVAQPGAAGNCRAQASAKASCLRTATMTSLSVAWARSPWACLPTLWLPHGCQARHGQPQNDPRRTVLLLLLCGPHFQFFTLSPLLAATWAG